jgi:hypothetical protein
MLYKVSVGLRHAHVPQRLCFWQRSLLDHLLSLFILLIELLTLNLQVENYSCIEVEQIPACSNAAKPFFVPKLKKRESWPSSPDVKMSFW